MKDYAVVILDLPPLDGNEPVEEELKESNVHLKSAEVGKVVWCVCVCLGFGV